MNVSRVVIRTVVAALAVGGLGCALVAPASAAPEGSYRVRSNGVLVSPEVGAYSHAYASCQPGSHVRGSWVYPAPGAGGPYFSPAADVDGASGAEIHVEDSFGTDWIAGDPFDQAATYRGADVWVGNKAWAEWEQGWVWITCDPN